MNKGKRCFRNKSKNCYFNNISKQYITVNKSKPTTIPIVGVGFLFYIPYPNMYIIVNDL